MKILGETRGPRQPRPGQWGDGAVTCTMPWKHSSAALCEQPNSAFHETGPRGCGGAAWEAPFRRAAAARGKRC